MFFLERGMLHIVFSFLILNKSNSNIYKLNIIKLNNTNLKCQEIS